MILAELKAPDRKTRALAARRLGWRREQEAVPALLEAATVARDELCSILDALGWIGDERAVPLAREYAARKLLSRRRSGVEALRNLGDEEGLEAARQRAIASLSEQVRQALAEIDPNDPGEKAAQQLREAIWELETKFRGREADTLYEIGDVATSAAARASLNFLPPQRAYVWRYVKSILKRAMLRRDPVTLGWAARRIESAAAKTLGLKKNVKSGRDGKMRETPIFRRKTQRYVLRSIWRYLRFMARHAPQRYAEFAAEILVQYSHEDAAKPQGTYGAFAHCFLLHRILWGRSERYHLVESSLRWRRRPGTQAQADRVEEYPELWDEHPNAYLRLLAAARLVEVQEFAVRAVHQRHPDLLAAADLDALRAMLLAPYPPTVELALAEMRRRFDPASPDWTLLLTVAEDDRDWVRSVAHDWLRETAPLWTRHTGPTMDWLDAKHPDIRLLAGELAAKYSADATPELRQELAALLLERLRSPEAEEGRHDAYAVVAAALAAEIDPRLSLDEVLALLEEGSGGAKAVAAAVLGRRPEAFDTLGERRVLGLAEDDLRAVRAAAQSLFNAVSKRFHDDPGLLFVLAESDWQDNRAFALAKIGELDFEHLGFDAVLALCDSNRVEVQNMGKEMVRRSFEEMDAEDVTRRLAEHPHRNVRRFVVDLVVDHLEPGAEALARLNGFFRAVLFDLRPERRLKRCVIDFLKERGLANADEAVVAAGILDDAIRTSFQMDFEHALVALTQLRLARPEVASLVTTSTGDQEAA